MFGLLGFYLLITSIDQGFGWKIVLGVIVGFGSLMLAARDLHRRRRARREGRDPSIVRIVDDPNR
jgi:uncharacterized membrane-anchored protein